ncbi:hypothetical protein ACJMK2_022171 [Sinanodonta woodiana]|uniref:Uncharacterized protein n=1 Tax=Sinanodonta woodiana TaxID=1069815 RepID=A0ABD3TI75_SINWO
MLQDGMAVALFAHALLIKMAHKTDDKDLKDKCEKVSCEFTTLAIGILKKGYEKGGVNLARKLLIHEQTRWPNTSCVLIAVNAENKQFISDHACQEVFNNIWMRNIKQNTGMLRNNLKLLLCIFLPFLILCLISFKKEKEHTTFNDRKTPIGQKANTGQNSNQENKPLKDTNTDRSKNGLEPTVWDKIKYFYQAPVVICFHNVFWSTSSKDIASKFYNYIKDGWNIIDIATVFLFLIGMILRIVDNPEVADSALVVHGVNLITFYLRLLHIFSVHKVLGPKLVMIIHMEKKK